MPVNPLYLALTSATLFCSLVAGLVFGFAVVVMPGIAKLDDRAFLSAFKQMDSIIQANHPAFMVVWVGSIFSVIVTAVLATLSLHGGSLYLAWFATALYLVAVQLPTIRYNIPLNNALQRTDIATLTESEVALTRARFEVPWNRWNRFRTLNAVVAVVAMLTLLLTL